MTTAQGASNSKKDWNKKLIPVWFCLALAVLTVIAFSPIRDSGFINLDDDTFVYENAYVQYGLNWNSTEQAFSPLSELTQKGGWVPLTWLSLMLDTQIFGFNASGYHLTNLLFHILNAILLFLVLHRMTKTLWASAFVAALFAIHPLHVESVAWIAERRDVLSTFFMMLTLGAYSYYVEKRNLTRYALVLLFLILGLMAKPMLVTLPFVLLLLDYWPLGRMSEARPGQKIQADIRNPVALDKPKKKPKKKDAEKEAIKQTLIITKPIEPEFQWSRIYPLLTEKIPLIVVAVLSSFLTYSAAQSVGFIHSELIPLDVRIGNAFVSYVTYIGQMIWPVNLAVFYPHPEGSIFWMVLGAVAILITVTFAVIRKIKQFPYLATGWFWYFGTLVPVIGIVQLGSQAMADRYTYIPLIGLFIIAAWGFPELLKKVNYRQEIILAVSVLCVLCLSILTWKQVGYWKDSLTLFDHTIKATKNNWFIYVNRGFAHNDLGNSKQALEDCGRAIELKPGFPTAYNCRGIAYKVLGNYRQAIEDYNRAIEMKPNFADAYSNRGNAYNNLGSYTQAIEDYNKAIEIKPGFAQAYINRGAAYIHIGNFRQAIENFNRAIEIRPDFAAAYMNRGLIYLNQGDKISGCRDARTACELGNCKLLEAANAKRACS